MIADTPESRELSPADAFEAALDWWREAGVEDDYRDAATSWLAEPVAVQAVASPTPRKLPEEPKQSPLQRAFVDTSGGGSIGGDVASYPNSLEKFREWWMSEASLSNASVSERIAPQGVSGAKLMILVPEPAGAGAKLIEAMARAMGIQAYETYLASALPAPATLPDWASLAERGLASVTRHHIALAKPQRVLVLGRSLAPLFGIAAQDARDPAVVHAGEQTLPLLLAPDLAELARSAPRRRAFWDRWLEWTA